jgi:hypothetical protein
MSDDIMTSVMQGFQMAHTIENDNRMREVAQQQAMLHQMQMAKLARDIIQQQEIQRAFNNDQYYSGDEVVPSQKFPGASELKQVSSPQPGGFTVKDPRLESYLSQFPEESRAAAEMLARKGQYEQAEKMPKLPVQEKFMNVPQGGTIIEPKTGRVVYQSDKKEKEIAPIGLDPVGLFPVYKSESGVPFSVDAEGNRKPYIIKAQLKSVVEQPAQFIPVQTNEGIRPFKSKGENSGTVGAPIGGKPAPEAEVNRGIQIGSLKDTLKTIKDNFNPDYVGPVAGRVGTAKEKLVDIPENQAMFYAATRDAADVVLRLRSGAQINEQEFKRLMSFLPDATLPTSQFKIRLKRFEMTLDSILKNQASQMQSGGYGKGYDIPLAPGTDVNSAAKDLAKPTGNYRIIKVR